MSFRCLSKPRGSVSTRYVEAFRLVDQMFTVFDTLQDRIVNDGLTKDSLTEEKAILIVALQKVSGALLSIAHLCDIGLTQDARTITRKIIEIAASVLYIYKDPDQKTQKIARFHAHGAVRTKLNLKEIDKEPKLFSDLIRDGMTSKREAIQRAYDSEKQSFALNGKGEVHGNFLKSWHGLSFHKLIVESGIAPELITWQLFSSSTHFSSDDIGTYIDLDSLEIPDGVDLEEIPCLLCTAVHLSDQIAGIVASGFSVTIDDKLRPLRDNLIAFDKEIATRIAEEEKNQE